MPRIESVQQLSLARQIDALCDRFEKQWLAGERPRLEEYLKGQPDTLHPQLLAALLPVELELMRRAGDEPSAEAYRRRFPNLSATVSEIFANLSAKKTADTSVSKESTRTGPMPAKAPVRPSTSDPLLDRIGRFQVVSVLGEGAFGRVYRATDPQLNREVAIKVPFERAIQTEVERERFLREARAAASIQHPNICPVHEVGELDGRPYIVMALIPGQTLADTIKMRRDSLPEKQAAVIVRKLALALDAAHKKGVVHRDLKPGNVMFDRERKDLVVTDFGLARTPSFGDAQATQSNVIMGTPAYMSPEQARGDSKSVGPASDIYTLGVILYELLCGQRPFQGSMTEVIAQHIHVEPEPPSKVRPGIDPRLEVAAMKALEKDPKARFASMKDFAAAMDAVLKTSSGASIETAKAIRTKSDPESSVGTETRRLADLFAVHAAEQKEASEAAVERAVRKARTPRWVFVLFGVLIFGGLAALAGIVFFTKSDKVKVTIELSEVDLADKSLSFFLDDQPISAEALANPIELKPGEHVLVVKRGNDIVKRLLLTVTGGRTPGIKVKDITPPPPIIPKKKKPTSTEDGFVSLFNGKDLTGWKAVGEPKWSWEDGRLIGSPAAPGKPGFLVTEADYDDFELKLQYRLAAAAGSGIFLRCDPTGSVSGAGQMELQFIDDEAHKSGPLNGTGAIWNVIPRKDAPPIKRGDWNDVRVRLKGRHIEAWINGTQTIDADLDAFSDKFTTVPGLKRKKGGIGLQQNQKSDVEFRNVRIKELAIAESPRAKALQLLKKGAALYVMADVNRLEITDPAKLPAEPFVVTGVSLDLMKGADALLAEVTTLFPDIEYLSFAETDATNAGMEKLRKLPKLKELYCESNPAVDEKGFAVLANLTNLRSAWVGVSRFGNNGARVLADLPELRYVRILATQIDDNGLLALQKAPKLDCIEGFGPAVTDAGLAHLKDYPSLKSLLITGTGKITDAGLAHLQNVKTLEGVTIAHIAITDAGLVHLAKCAQLKFISFSNTKVSEKGLADLRKALPFCRIMPEPKEDPEPGFNPIFNGKDLTGWTSNRKLTVFSVDENGSLVIEGDTTGVLTWLVTEKEYSDFILRLEFQYGKKRLGPVDSGVAIRGLPDRSGAQGAKLRFSLHNDPKFRHPLGALVYTVNDSIAPAEAASLKPDGDWNALEIEAIGPRVRMSLNGKLVNDVDLSKIDRSTIGKKEDYARTDLERKAGRIGLQCHYGTTKFRNIRLKDLAKPVADKEPEVLKKDPKVVEPAVEKKEPESKKEPVPPQVAFPATQPFAEDFSKTREGDLPAGWKGDDAIHVRKQGDKPRLEVAGKGMRTVTLPAVSLGKNFFVEWEFIGASDGTFELTLLGHEGGKDFPISMLASGGFNVYGASLQKITIPEVEPKTSKTQMKPVHRLRLEREGDIFRLKVDGDTIHARRLPGYRGFSGISIGLSGGEAPTTRFYSIRTGMLADSPQEKAAPADADKVFKQGFRSDFQKVVEGDLPAGWKGDAAVAIRKGDGEKARLELAGKGPNSVTTPDIHIDGNFFVEMEMTVASGSTMELILEGRSGAPDLTLSFRGSGGFATYGASLQEIKLPGLDPKTSKTQSKPEHRLRLEREGEIYRVVIDGETIHAQRLPGFKTFARVRINMANAEPPPTRIFGIRVGPMA